MTAYENTSLENIQLHQLVQEMVRKKYITPGRGADILQNYPVNVYRSNKFIMVGVGLLTIVIISFSFGLFMLMANGNNAELLSFFFILFSYTALELLVAQHKYYNGGVDNILMAAVVSFLFFSFGSGTYSSVLALLFASLTCVWLCLRFADRFAAVAAFVLFLCFVVQLFSFFPGYGFALPCTLIIISALTYILSTRRHGKPVSVIYQPVWFSLAAVSLVTLYVSANFYVVDNILFNKQVHLSGSFSAFLWGWTLLFPPVLLFLGVRSKKVVFLRIGLLLAVAAVLTFRYYYHVLPAEWALTLAGALLVIGGYVFISLLKKGRKGFIFRKSEIEISENNALHNIVIGSVLSKDHPVAVSKGFDYGGGSFGGAGAGEKY